MRTLRCLFWTWTTAGAVLCLSTAGAFAAGTAKTGENLRIPNAPGTAGTVCAVPVTGSWTGLAIAPSTLVFKAAWDAGWIQFTGVSAGSALAGSGKTFDFEPKGKSVTVVVYGGNYALPEGDLVCLNFQVDPAAVSGTFAAIRDTGSNASDGAGNPVALTTANGALTVSVGAKTHSADYSRDWRISLSELLRVVQFYNIGSFHCDATTEDGFAPGPGDQGCTPHDTDYRTRNWAVSLNELLRMIQFYNAPGGSYQYSPGSEDNYAMGAWVPY